MKAQAPSGRVGEELPLPYAMAAAAYGVLLVAALLSPQSSARLGIYLFPAILLVISLIANRTIRLDPPSITAVLLITLSYLPSLLLVGTDVTAYKEYLFVLATPLSFIFCHRLPPKFVNAIGISICVACVVSLTRSSATPMDVNFLDSDSGGLESQVAFPAAALALYFIARSEYRWAAVMTLATVLGFKRGAVIALVAAGGACVVMRFFNLLQSRRTRFAACAFVFSSGLLISLALPALSESLEEFLPSDVSTNQFMAGRQLVNAVLVEMFLSGSPGDVAFGSGVGFTTAFVQGKLGWAQPHNDFIRILLDIGVIGFGFFAAAWICFFDSGRLQVPLCIFTSVLFLFDNTYIYLYHNIVIGICARGYSTAAYSGDVLTRRAGAQQVARAG